MRGIVLLLTLGTMDLDKRHLRQVLGGIKPAICVSFTEMLTHHAKHRSTPKCASA